MNHVDFLPAAERIIRDTAVDHKYLKPSEWAETTRMMTSDVSRFEGKFSYERTPYLREIVDCLSPEHPARKIGVMKGAQIGFTAGVIENGIGWIIDQSPAPVYLGVGDEESLKKLMTHRIDNMIKYCGLDHKIRPNAIRRTSRRTGDTIFEKEFQGGRLQGFITSQHKKIRQVSVKYGFMDDYETAPFESEKSGATEDLIDQRFASYGNTRKQFFISTPELEATSNIKPIFDRGDQRRFFIPCPKCGDFQPLEWTVKRGREQAGIFYQLDKTGRLKTNSVGYKCQSCGSVWQDHHKPDVMPLGEWRPTTRAKDDDVWSFHISALYAPLGMFDWTYYVKQYLKAMPPDGIPQLHRYKAFVNLCLGKTWKKPEQKVSIKQLASNTRDYPIGTIPAELARQDGNGEIVLVTCACDLNGEQDDARLDFEIVAWCENRSSYSIEHGSVGTFIPARRKTGKNKRADEKRERWTYQHNRPLSVWPVFEDILQRTFPTDEGNGRQYRIMFTGIDTGFFTVFANQFVEDHKNFIHPVVGLKGERETRFKNVDALQPFWKKSQKQLMLYAVDVNAVKDELSMIVQQRWTPKSDRPQPGDFMNFPQPSGGLYTYGGYFKHFEAEHKVEKTDSEGRVTSYLWEKRNSDVENHFYDCRVYNHTMKEMFARLVAEEQGIKSGGWLDYCNILLGRNR